MYSRSGVEPVQGAIMGCRDETRVRDKMQYDVLVLYTSEHAVYEETSSTRSPVVCDSDSVRYSTTRPGWLRRRVESAARCLARMGLVDQPQPGICSCETLEDPAD